MKTLAVALIIGILSSSSLGSYVSSKDRRCRSNCIRDDHCNNGFICERVQKEGCHRKIRVCLREPVVVPPVIVNPILPVVGVIKDPITSVIDVGRNGAVKHVLTQVHLPKDVHPSRGDVYVKDEVKLNPVIKDGGLVKLPISPKGIQDQMMPAGPILPVGSLPSGDTLIDVKISALRVCVDNCLARISCAQGTLDCGRSCEISCLNDQANKGISPFLPPSGIVNQQIPEANKKFNDVFRGDNVNVVSHINQIELGPGLNNPIVKPINENYPTDLSGRKGVPSVVSLDHLGGNQGVIDLSHLFVPQVNPIDFHLPNDIPGKKDIPSVVSLDQLGFNPLSGQRGISDLSHLSLPHVRSINVHDPTDISVGKKVLIDSTLNIDQRVPIKDNIGNKRIINHSEISVKDILTKVGRSVEEVRRGMTGGSLAQLDPFTQRDSSSDAKQLALIICVENCITNTICRQGTDDCRLSCETFCLNEQSQIDISPFKPHISDVKLGPGINGPIVKSINGDIQTGLSGRKNGIPSVVSLDHIGRDPLSGHQKILDISHLAVPQVQPIESYDPKDISKHNSKKVIINANLNSGKFLAINENNGQEIIHGGAGFVDSIGNIHVAPPKPMVSPLHKTAILDDHLNRQHVVTIKANSGIRNVINEGGIIHQDRSMGKTASIITEHQILPVGGINGKLDSLSKLEQLDGILPFGHLPVETPILPIDSVRSNRHLPNNPNVGDILQKKILSNSDQALLVDETGQIQIIDSTAPEFQAIDNKVISESHLPVDHLMPKHPLNCFKECNKDVQCGEFGECVTRGCRRVCLNQINGSPKKKMY